MIKTIIKGMVLSSLVASIAFSADIIAVVNGKNITTEVAPKDFASMDMDMKKKIANRLVEKRLASDYALSTDIVNSEQFIKSLEHVLNMSLEKTSKDDNLADMINSNKAVKGYTKEQLNSKKGLLAFDFLLNDKAEKLNPSEETLKEYYEMTKYKYDTPAMKELLSIVVEDEALAKEIIKKLENAQDSLETFSKLAKEHSLAPSKDNFGYFGKVPVNTMNEVLKPLLKDLKKNEFARTAQKTEFGYQIFYVLNDIPEYNSEFEGVDLRVKEEYIKKEIKTWAMEKIKELKSKADIKIML